MIKVLSKKRSTIVGEVMETWIVVEPMMMRIVLLQGHLRGVGEERLIAMVKMTESSIVIKPECKRHLLPATKK
jgi:hypothetical protein